MADISVIRVGSSDYTLKDADARTDINELYSIKAPKNSPVFTGTPTTPTPDTNENSTQIANTAWVKARISDALSGADAMVYKGTIGASGATITTKTLPNDTAKTGWTYKAVAAGAYTVGTGTGTGTTTVNAEIGDMFIALTSGSSTTYATWTVVQNNIDGAVTGPASSTDAHIAVFNGTTGKVIKDSGYTIATSVPSGAVFTDTKNTAGSTNSSSKLYLIGATSQAANPQTYSNSHLYVEGTLFTFTADVNIGEDLTVTDHLSVGESASFADAVEIDGGLTAHQPAEFTDDVTLTGGDLDVTGNISVTSGNITVGGTAVSLVGHTHNYAGSSSAGGAATSANKLNTNAGSATNPVYFSGGVPVACTYSLNKTVPSDAVFTDTKNTAGTDPTRTGTFYLIGAGSQESEYGTTRTWDGRAFISGGTLYIEDLNVDGNGYFEGTVECDALTVNGTAVSLVGHTHTFSGTTKKFAFTGTAGNATASYTPAGTISKPNITVTPSTTTVNSITAVGTLPTWSASVSGETLSFSWSQGTLPTKGANTTVMTGASAALASTPAFTGTAATITSSYTPAGTIAINASSGTGTSYTPEGSVNGSTS